MANTPFARFVVIEFACRHRREFPAKGNIPQKGDAMYCLKCRAETTVIKHLEEYRVRCSDCRYSRPFGAAKTRSEIARSEEHTSELQSLMRISYAVFCLKKKRNQKNNNPQQLN